MAEDRKPPVVLVHGLWLGPWSMKRLAKAFMQHGFPVRTFGYPTVNASIESSARALADFAADLAPERVDFVAHSLGGIVAMEALQLLSGRIGRIVLLGTPLTSCEVAQRFCRWPGGRRLMGQALSGLSRQTPAPPAGWQAGMIAGRVRLGLGLLAGGWRKPGDGTVALTETQADYLTDHIVLKQSHTSLQLSRKVAETAAGFLETGRFARGN